MLPYFTRISSVIFWLLISLVTFLLLMEQQPSAPLFPHVDKLIHASVFATLMAIGYAAYAQHLTLLCLGLISYGAITEVLQGTYTLTRSASLYDWLADITGVLLCILIINKLKSHHQKHHVR